MTNEQIEELLLEIHRTPLLSMEEELELLEKIQAEGADCEELEKLVNANLRFAVSLAGQYMNRGLDIRELIPIGAEGLKEAALTYDLNGDTKFLSHAVPVMRKYFENPNYFKNSYQFVHHVCPGFYVKIKDGTGAMAYVNISWMVVYFKIKDEDGNEEVGRTSFSGTEEVLQTTRITNDQRSIERLVSDNSCTYIKSPAGIFTELTLPVDEIINNHENDTLNTARLSLTKMIDWSDSDYKFNMPTYLLMVPKDSLYTFFEKNSLPNNITSYVKERDHTSISTGSSYYSQRVIKKYKDSYTFDNISNLIRHMAETKKKGGSDYTIKHPNWNKVVIVPVTVNTTTTTSGGTAISRVMNDMSPTSLRLVGGSENVNGDIHISVIYSKFSNK